MANTKFQHIAPTYEERIDYELIELMQLAEIGGRDKFTIKEICRESVFSFVKHEQHIKLRISVLKRSKAIIVIKAKLSLPPKPLARVESKPVQVNAALKPAVKTAPKPVAAVKPKPASKPNQETSEDKPVIHSEEEKKPWERIVKEPINPDLRAAAIDLKERLEAGEKVVPKIDRLESKLFAVTSCADVVSEPMRSILLEIADDLEKVSRVA